MAQTQGLVLSYLKTVQEQCFLFFSGLISRAFKHIALTRNGAGIYRLLASRLGICRDVERGDESVPAGAGYPVVLPFASRWLRGGVQRCRNHYIKF